MRSARDPWRDGQPPHVPAPAELLGEFPAVCLLPGDPGRVDLSGSVLDDFAVIGSRREFRLGIGQYAGQQIAVCSTGIGGPSTEIVVVELARLGVRTVLRVGGMGSLGHRVQLGDVCAVESALIGGGAGRLYAEALGLVDSVAASSSVLSVLDDAASELNLRMPRISVLSADSYYLGEGRPVGGHTSISSRRSAELASLEIEGVDMETETVFAVGRAMGLEVGALLVAHANRNNDEWLEDYEHAQRTMLTLACAAAARLTGPTQR